jgi:hypothetical protein
MLSNASNEYGQTYVSIIYFIKKLTSIALIVSHLFVVRVSILWVGFKNKITTWL